ncbi:MAG: CPBP family intramembrane metalloprotease [Phycisphaerales bacterium]|nr:MAG: CPBP family intramembrane metalloprotease [Phycisphaerales bacterium]
MSPQNSRIGFALVPAMVVPFFASMLYFVVLSESRLAPVIYVCAKLFILVWPITCAYFVPDGRLPKLGGDVKRYLRALSAGAVLGIAILISMFALMQTPLGEIVTANADGIESKARQFGVLEHYWLFALFLSVAHSLIEEHCWRWFVFGHLKKVLAIWHAHIIAAISFAAHHVVVTTQFFGVSWGLLPGGCVGVAGIMWTLMYDRQKTLAGAWVCHLIVDLGIMAVGYRILFGSSPDSVGGGGFSHRMHPPGVIFGRFETSLRNCFALAGGTHLPV